MRLQRPGEEVGAHSLAINRNRDGYRADAGQQVQNGWKARVLDNNAITQMYVRADQTIDCVECTIEDGDSFGIERPRRSQDALQLGQYRLAEVACREIRTGDGGERGRQVGEQRGIRCSTR